MALRQFLIYIFLIGHVYCFSQSSTAKTIKIRKDTSSLENGQRLYTLNCSMCHETIKKAPKLNGVTKKYARPWILDFIENSERLYYLKDSITLKIMADWKDERHIVFEGSMSKKDIENIYEFIKKYKP